MTGLPNVPTDSLYKFIALFGLILFGFGLWYPWQRFAAAEAGIRETNKSQDLVRIRINRNNVRVDRLAEQLKAKSAVLRERKKRLDEVDAALDSKRQALFEALDRVKSKSDVDNAKSQSDALTSEVDLLMAQMRDLVDALSKLNAEHAIVITDFEDVTDEMASESAKLKASTTELEAFNEQANLWLVFMIGFCFVGLVMIFAGFRLWYVRIQVHQDAILRKQAAS